MDTDQEIKSFLDGWQKDDIDAKKAFVDYEKFLREETGVSLDFKARPGISYSLRAKNSAQKNRNLFVLVDVVDDDPDERWLSVCFYADMVTDPEDIGDIVPEGLEGEDAICFNLDENDAHLREYIGKRIAEASAKAAL